MFNSTKIPFNKAESLYSLTLWPPVSRRSETAALSSITAMKLESVVFWHLYYNNHLDTMYVNKENCESAKPLSNWPTWLMSIIVINGDPADLNLPELRANPPCPTKAPSSPSANKKLYFSADRNQE